MMGDWGYHGGWLGMGIGMIVWVAVVALVIWLIVRAFSGRAGGGGESAEELLRRRFASGEIDAEEYQKRLEVLRKR